MEKEINYNPSKAEGEDLLYMPQFIRLDQKNIRTTIIEVIDLRQETGFFQEENVLVKAIREGVAQGKLTPYLYDGIKVAEHVMSKEAFEQELSYGDVGYSDSFADEDIFKIELKSIVTIIEGKKISYEPYELTLILPSESIIDYYGPDMWGFDTPVVTFKMEELNTYFKTLMKDGKYIFQSENGKKYLLMRQLQNVCFRMTQKSSSFPISFPMTFLTLFMMFMATFLKKKSLLKSKKKAKKSELIWSHWLGNNLSFPSIGYFYKMDSNATKTFLKAVNAVLNSNSFLLQFTLDTSLPLEDSLQKFIQSEDFKAQIIEQDAQYFGNYQRYREKYGDFGALVKPNFDIQTRHIAETNKMDYLKSLLTTNTDFLYLKILYEGGLTEEEAHQALTRFKSVINNKFFLQSPYNKELREEEADKIITPFLEELLQGQTWQLFRLNTDFLYDKYQGKNIMGYFYLLFGDTATLILREDNQGFLLLTNGSD